MTITIDLQPEVERGLLAQANARGVSLHDYAQQVLAREACVSPELEERTGQALVDVCAEVRGLLSDEEVDTLFARNRMPSRPVDL